MPVRSPRNCAEVECALLTQTPGVAVFYNRETHTLFIIREELRPRCPIAVGCVTASQFIENKFIPGCYIQVKSTGSSSISRSGSTPTHLERRKKTNIFAALRCFFSFLFLDSAAFQSAILNHIETVGGFRIVNVGSLCSRIIKHLHLLYYLHFFFSSGPDLISAPSGSSDELKLE